MSGNSEQEALAREWLAYAEGDLRSAKILNSASDAPRRNVCYLAQQCAEKSLKALLILWGMEVIRTHDLDALLRRFPADIREQFSQIDCSWLSEWNMEGRYPGDWPEATSEDANKAVEMAEAVYEKAAAWILRRARG